MRHGKKISINRINTDKTMALTPELQTLTKAFSGLGVDEKALVAILGKSHPEERQSFRKATTPHFFKEDERSFERWDDHHIKLLKHEFLRFKNAVVLWTMHPWERDARLAKEALKKGPESYGMLVEIACTRSSEELLGARKAYHSLFDHSIEEDVAYHIDGPEGKLLVALVSSYRYEGSKVKDDTAKSEAKTLVNAIKDVYKRHPNEDDEVIRILSTRSKPHLKEVSKHYKEISSHDIDEDLDHAVRLKETVQCLCTPEKYFSKVLEDSLRTDVHKHAKKGLTRVIVTRAHLDMVEIKEEFENHHGVSLVEKIEETANGNYKDFLLTLLAKGG